MRWFRLDPCLVTHVLGAYEEAANPTAASQASAPMRRKAPSCSMSCCYAAPEVGQPVDLSASVVGPAGIGLTTIGGSLGVLERWRIVGEDVQRTLVDERYVEYPRIDAACDATAFRYGYSLEMTWGDAPESGDGAVPPRAARTGTRPRSGC